MDTVDQERSGDHARSGQPRALSLLASHRPRNVGWPQAAALLFGDWGTSRLYVLGLAFAFTGKSSFWLICAMSLLVLAVAWAYTQICRIYPDGGGVYAAARQRSQILAVVGALLLFADYVITASLSALEAFHYFGLPEHRGLLFSPGLWAIVGIAVIGVLNLAGPKHAAGFAIVAAVAMVVVTLIVVVGSFLKLSPDQLARSFEPIHESPARTWVHFVSIVLALSGVEAIANLTGVLKKPVAQTAARSIWIVAVEVAIFNVLIALVMVATSERVGVAGMRAHENDMLAFLAGHHVGAWAEWGVRIVGGVLLLSATNTAIGGIIAVLYLLSRDSELPRPLQSLNRFGVPFLPALIAAAVPALVLVFTHEVTQLAALYAIGVVGAVAINVALCAFHPRLRRAYRKGPMVVLGVLLLAIWVTLAFTKLHALIFVIAVMTIGLSLRALTKWYAAREGDKPSLLRQAIIEQMSDATGGKEKVLLGTYGSTHLADQAINYCVQHDAMLVVNFIRELNLNHRFDSSKGRLTIDTDPVALKTFATFLEMGHAKNVPIMPAYDTGQDAAELMAETAALYGADRILIGTSRRGTLHRIVKGTFQTRLETLLPAEIKVDVVDAQTT